MEIGGRCPSYTSNIGSPCIGWLSKKQIRTKAEELVQDVWQKRASLQVRQVTPYLFTALKYAVIDHIRHRVQQERFEGYQQQHQDGFRTTVPNTYSIIMT